MNSIHTIKIYEIHKDEIQMAAELLFHMKRYYKLCK